MTPKLARMSPLDCFFNLPEFDWSHLKLPENYHLVVTATGKVKSVRGKANYIDSRGVSAL